MRLAKITKGRTAEVTEGLLRSHENRQGHMRLVN